MGTRLSPTFFFHIPISILIEGGGECTELERVYLCSGMKNVINDVGIIRFFPPQISTPNTEEGVSVENMKVGVS